MRRGFATLLPLGLLVSFLLAVTLAIMLYSGFVSLPLAVVLVIIINVGILLISPWLNDRLYEWLYDVAMQSDVRSPISARSWPRLSCFRFWLSPGGGPWQSVWRC